MVSAPAWRRSPVGACWPNGALRGASAYRLRLRTVNRSLPRLKRRQDFLRVAKLGRKWAAQGVVLQCAPCPDGLPPGAFARVGYTASRKVGGAVRRNRARRRLRAAAEAVLRDQARSDRDFVLIARVGTATRPYAALLEDLTTALTKVGGRAELVS